MVTVLQLGLASAMALGAMAGIGGAACGIVVAHLTVYCRE